ncbi:hypothetical protein FE257_007710 [Aspergillus nanangensis]|uniref:Uncharacterized protein n=1 Tax=Aspergillus nanangensis TaxID=2582783 RepID=A0AAD4H006_ASPNN|nr:hypothetical protein FE257_007710 [Aspergillus nanangensis]
MPLIDKERARGLRIPSLSAMKLQKKSAPMSPESPPPKDPMPVAAVPPPVFPPRTDSAPIRPPRPQEKELPPKPLVHAAASISPSSPPAPTPFSNPIHPYNDRPLPSFPRVPVPKQTESHVSAPAPVQQRTPPSSESEPEPEPEVLQRQQHQRQQHQRQLDQQHLPPSQPRREPIPAPRREPYPPQPPYHHAPEPEPAQPNGAEEDPLEDFIPDPEPELDDSDAAIDRVSSEENQGPWTPPDYDPVAPPLSKVHFNCYQEHRSMRPAQNMWHPLPCMTCQKFDQELRYRCVFCCLRICAGCLSALQKSPSHDLEQLMQKVSPGEQGQGQEYEHEHNPAVI